MISMILEIYRRYQANKARWEDICHQCGDCCYSRARRKDGTVQIYYSAPCPYLDTHTRKCTVYENRFEMCEYCGKVTIWQALFNRTMPDRCGYVEMFRLWKKRKEY